MANVINRKTKEILVSINTPDYPEPEWMIINGKYIPPRPSKYWKIINNQVLEINKQEKTVIDYIEPEPVRNPPKTQYDIHQKVDSLLPVLLDKYPSNP